ncbi:hypothetical protein CYMTET_10159 [Cymbomonas tetramitiformis]|uniref:Protein-tyrosine-phosphatase n=1 Tax=Cymbomonas tetramitiformis TaxID=36881 RepID=A0AAE0GQ35_9CHLO|nr:hypothetical protein CYMTET_10159 [Cymbomonas tetramitiformis]|eukprot:gene13124-15496_t
METLNPTLGAFLVASKGAVGDVSEDRAAALSGIAADLAKLVSGAAEGTKINLNFVCTHNSRRSHMGACAAAAVASFHGLGDRVATFSSGTEGTAFYPSAVAALRSAGFHVSTEEGTSETNPVYLICVAADGSNPMRCWSKAYTDDSICHPFTAIMVCDSADKGCPLIKGAQSRHSLTYQDPKAGDKTPEELEGYQTRLKQIAGEMMLVFEEAKAILSS